MFDFLIETFRPATRSAGNKTAPKGFVVVKTHKRKGFVLDDLHPSMTSLWHVKNADSGAAAMAAIIEVAAGLHRDDVRCLAGAERHLGELPPLE